MRRRVERAKQKLSVVIIKLIGVGCKDDVVDDTLQRG
jgi:hypothetical protein